MFMAGTGFGGRGCSQGTGSGSAGCNPRKFSEKIALHTQRQAEDTAAFQEVMMDITSTKVSEVSMSVWQAKIAVKVAAKTAATLDGK